MKANKTKNLLRIENIIERDRLSVGADFSRLLEYDITTILAEYADLDGRPLLTIEKSEKGFMITVKTHAVRLKNVIPLKLNAK